ncbi:MAG: CDP-alcohol phosphatidyltransferase family protein [Bacteroidales bacterium]|nr:CDP-alcohol phosphatidyltransferase family protein [Bacteroidales bacterium]MBQ9702431.1 CDP-alcohol phosphatidyltransferase family protein [Bacteroidales bacterium]MBR1782711.1 CDP-alcohol phosphatidyltransferase family protein [Bacteroidales bacterium]
MSEEKKQAARIQTSILNPLEKKILVWLAQRMPAWVTSDMLTFVGFLGAVIMGVGYALSNLNLHWLWLSCFGLLVNWFGDSLDGSLARVRGTQRKTYGFFIDHNVDVINETIMFVGVGCSPLVNMSFAMMALVGYFMLSIYVYIDCHLKGEMRLTYGGLGPTEFRLLLILVNIAFMYIPWLSTWKKDVVLFHNQFSVGLFDYIAVAAAVLLFVFYLTGFFKDIKYYSKIDPPVKK